MQPVSPRLFFSPHFFWLTEEQCVDFYTVMSHIFLCHGHTKECSLKLLDLSVVLDVIISIHNFAATMLSKHMLPTSQLTKGF